MVEAFMLDHEVPLPIWGITNVGRDVERHRQPEYNQISQQSTPRSIRLLREQTIKPEIEDWNFCALFEYWETFHIGLNEPRAPNVQGAGGRL